MIISRWLTTDKIIAVGLVIALVISEIIGGDSQLQNNIAIGLVGFLGGRAVDKKGGIPDGVEKP